VVNTKIMYMLSLGVHLGSHMPNYWYAGDIPLQIQYRYPVFSTLNFLRRERAFPNSFVCAVYPEIYEATRGLGQ